MLKSDLIIAGSNFIFSHINENYSEYLNLNKKFLVIFRGINTEYFNSSKIHQTDQKKLISKWNISKEKPLILLPGRLDLLERSRNVHRSNSPCKSKNCLKNLFVL